MNTEKIVKVVFLLAAIYNIIWGTVVVLFPNLFFDIFDIERINYPFLMSGIGMFVGVYGYGYYVVAKYPKKYPQLVVIGLLGKVLGPIGWAYHVYLGSIPAATLLTNLFNDIIWIPFFIWYLIWIKKQHISLF
ncbi:MAG: alkyl hydroperoxide reductase [Flammeovirgaceae bacterium]